MKRRRFLPFCIVVGVPLLLLVVALSLPWLLVAVYASGPANWEPPQFAPGAPAPDFRLTDVDGKPFHLSAEAVHSPVVLEFGSATCAWTPSVFGAMEGLARKYRGRVPFALVYCLEAHPDQPFPVRCALACEDSPMVETPSLHQTANVGERTRRAADFLQEHGGGERRVLADGDGPERVEPLYGAAGSDRIVVVQDGRIVLSCHDMPPRDLDAFLQALVGAPN